MQYLTRTATALLVFLIIMAPSVRAQDTEAAKMARLMDKFRADAHAFIAKQEAFLEEQGRLGDARQLHQALNQAYQVNAAQKQTRQRPEGLSVQDHQEMIAMDRHQKAINLALRGLNTERIAALESRGIDVLEIALKPGITLTPAESAVLSELVIVGRIKRIEQTQEPGDGYRSSVVVEVVETLVGQAPGDEIVIRQLSGDVGPGGEWVRYSTDFHKFDEEQEVLFFLSNTLYRYQIAYPTDSMVPRRAEGIAQAPLHRHFLQAYLPIKFPSADAAPGKVGQIDVVALRATLRSIGERIDESFARD